MESNSKKYLTMVLALLVLSSQFLMSCKKDEEAPDNQPDLPPVSTMVMDFSDFESGNSRTQAVTKATWARGAIHVGVWNLALTFTLVVPVASYGEAFNHRPSYDFDEEKWKWEYDVNVGGKHTCTLYGKVDGDSVRWQMFISKQFGYQDHLWYEGASSIDRTGGWWLLNYGPDKNGDPFLMTPWERNADDTEAKIRYTNVTPNDEHNGGFIEYGVDQSTPFDAHYEIFNKSNGNLTDKVNVNWSRTTGEGQLSDPAFYGDTDFRCWDQDQNDITCP